MQQTGTMYSRSRLFFEVLLPHCQDTKKVSTPIGNADLFCVNHDYDGIPPKINVAIPNQPNKITVSPANTSGNI